MKLLIKKLLLFSLIFLVGCSSTTFVYNRIDFLLPWSLESYVDLNRGQKQDLKELLIPFFKWHREEELPSYVAIIEDLELTLDSSVEFESIAEITNDVEESWFRLEDRMLLWATPMTRDLSEKQIDADHKQVCDLDTGDCYTIRMKDGLIERFDNFILELNPYHKLEFRNFFSQRFDNKTFHLSNAILVSLTIRA